MNILNLRITSYCNISKGKIFAKDKVIYTGNKVEFDLFINEAYNQLALNYPKFHKMDNLSKLGWLASEIIFKDVNLSNGDPYKFVINIMNRDSSLDTDIIYQNLIENNKSGPSVFVYTLPNIMIGEICIKNNIKGDNLLQISETFDIPLQYNYIDSLFKNKMAEKSICGWVNFDKDEYKAFLYVVENTILEANLPFTIESINKLFKKRPNEFRGAWKKP